MSRGTIRQSGILAQSGFDLAMTGSEWGFELVERFAGGSGGCATGSISLVSSVRVRSGGGR